MSRWAAVALLAGGIVTRMPAQSLTLSPPTAPGAGASPDCVGQGADARTLLRLEDEWATALVRRDETTFRRLLADGFVYTEDDRTVSRDVALQDIVAGPDTVEAAHNADMRVHCFGTTAAVTGWLITRGRGAGGPFDRRYRFTDTWMRQRGLNWQVVAAHDYLVPAQRH